MSAENNVFLGLKRSGYRFYFYLANLIQLRDINIALEQAVQAKAWYVPEPAGKLCDSADQGDGKAHPIDTLLYSALVKFAWITLFF